MKIKKYLLILPICVLTACGKTESVDTVSETETKAPLLQGITEDEAKKLFDEMIVQYMFEEEDAWIPDTVLNAGESTVTQDIPDET